MPKEATCASFMCIQQGSECDVWDGQPVCKCRDRCEREPRFTCASDGMTYYNKCYMDAEACSKGITLSVVTCHFHLSWPNTSPTLPQASTLRPTTAPLQATVLPQPQPPVMATGPTHQTVKAGETASFLCDATGHPRPEIAWEKHLPEGGQRLIIGPNQVRGNMVVTNIGQLVIYNAQPGDSGVYTCTAQNPSGSVRAEHPLTVVPAEPPETSERHNLTHCLSEECVRPIDASEECAGDVEKVSWYFEPKTNNCFSFAHCRSNSTQSQKLLTSYAECMACCGPELSEPCGLPALQGPCKSYEPRWAYSGSLRRCLSFIYGGCEGNANNFESKEACEEVCPYRKEHHCRACKPRGKIVTSFCRSDFVVLGRVTALTEDKDSGHALVTIDEILKDEMMGLRFFRKEPLEVSFLDVDWSCPCPSIKGGAAEGQLIIMGNVRDGVAVLQPHSYLGASSPRRVRKLREVISKNTCDILKTLSHGPQ